MRRYLFLALLIASFSAHALQTVRVAATIFWCPSLGKREPEQLPRFCLGARRAVAFAA